MSGHCLSAHDHTEKFAYARMRSRAAPSDHYEQHHPVSAPIHFQHPFTMTASGDILIGNASECSEEMYY